MTNRTILTATTAMAFAFVLNGNAWAQDFDPCAGLTGKAKGLCTAYTVGMGCSSDDPDAGPEACNNVATMLEEVTGSPPPSECPCNFSLDRIRSQTEGWTDLTDVFRCTSFPVLAGLFDQFSGTNRRDQMLAQNRGPNLSFRCSYLAQGVALDTFEEEVPPFGDITVEEISRFLEACRGAILTAAATVSVSSDNTCGF